KKSICQTGTSPSAMALHRELNALKQRPTYPQNAFDVQGMDRGCTRCPNALPMGPCATWIAPLTDSFARRVTFKQAGKYRGRVGYPKRMSKTKGLGGFRPTGSIVIFPDASQLPRLGRLRVKERGYLPTTGTMSGVKALSATVA